MAPQETLTSVAVIVRAWSDATKTTTMRTSTSVAVRFRKQHLHLLAVTQSIAKNSANTGARTSGATS